MFTYILKSTSFVKILRDSKTPKTYTTMKFLNTSDKIADMQTHIRSADYTNTYHDTRNQSWGLSYYNKNPLSCSKNKK
ncbi:hypothetical protein CICLE_v10029725mg [Citrus x clementina]|uniref:Uncharacterized protein n=1 Tax=Citrus clementina TaxID=85681 RepID=V4UD74_CITCL|nr:hypothetical protein CICLE_v10029725mg [Citrus x clementina]